MILTNLTSKEIATHLSATAIDNFKIIGKTKAIRVDLLRELYKVSPDSTFVIRSNEIYVLKHNVDLNESVIGIKVYEI